MKTLARINSLETGRNLQENHTHTHTPGQVKEVGGLGVGRTKETDASDIQILYLNRRLEGKPAGAMGQSSAGQRNYGVDDSCR